MKVKFVPADTTKPTEFREITNTNQLQQLQGLVGGYVEQVKTQYMINAGFVMLVNEDGHAFDLRRNPRANEISHYPSPIVGDVVFVGFRRHDGEWIDYPHSW